MTNGEVKRNMNYCQDEFSFDPRKHVLGVYLDEISRNCTDIFEGRGAIREKKRVLTKLLNFIARLSLLKMSVDNLHVD